MLEFENRCLKILSQIVVIKQDVVDIVVMLDVNKAVGPDTVSNRMLLADRNEFAEPLCLLFNWNFLDDLRVLS